MITMATPQVITPQIMQLPKHFERRTVVEWTELCPIFNSIFSTAYIDPIKPFLGTENFDSKLFMYFLAKQYNRVVTPEMTSDNDRNETIVSYIKDLISLRSYGLKYKYEMLAETMPNNFDDFLENYNMHREYTKTKEVEEGTVTNSGSDTSYNNVDVRTTNESTTGESERPRLKDQSRRYTYPDGETDQSNNSMKTNYGRIITSAPGTETDSFSQDASGYYGSASKAKIIANVRELLNIDIIDMWLHDIIPCFCLSTFSPKPLDSYWAVL